MLQFHHNMKIQGNIPSFESEKDGGKKMKIARRLLALILIASLCAGTISMTAFAAQTDVKTETINNEDGTTTDITTTTTTEVDPETGKKSETEVTLVSRTAAERAEPADFAITGAEEATFAEPTEETISISDDLTRFPLLSSSYP